MFILFTIRIELIFQFQITDYGLPSFLAAQDNNDTEDTQYKRTNFFITHVVEVVLIGI